MGPKKKGGTPLTFQILNPEFGVMSECLTPIPGDDARDLGGKKFLSQPAASKAAQRSTALAEIPLQACEALDLDEGRFKHAKRPISG